MAFICAGTLLLRKNVILQVHISFMLNAIFWEKLKYGFFCHVISS